VRVAQVDPAAGGQTEPGVFGQLGALIPGQRANQVPGQPGELVPDHGQHLRAGPVDRQGTQQHVPGGAFDQGDDRRAAAAADQQVTLPMPGYLWGS
jgi:hypothetical protein